MEITEYNIEQDAPAITALSLTQSNLASDLSLPQDAILCAWFEAFGMKPAEIEVELSRPAGSVMTLRRTPDYQILLMRCISYVTRKRTGSARNPEELFNNEIVASAQALIEVRDSPFSKGGERIKAAVAFLDRAPKAPKVRKEIDERSIVISIPLSELQNMQQALLEEGSGEDNAIHDLLKGTDYTIEEDDAVKKVA